MIAIYIVFNLSCICSTCARAVGVQLVLLHLVVPVVGILVFLPAWFTALGIGSVVAEVRLALVVPGQRDRADHRIWYAIGVVVLITCTSGTPRGCRR